MPYITEQLPDEPIVITRISSEWPSDEEMDAIAGDLLGVLDAAGEAVYAIFDLRKLTFGLTKVMSSARGLTGSISAVLDHPYLGDCVFVTDSRALKVALNSIRLDVDVHIVDSMPDAMLHVHEEMIHPLGITDVESIPR